MSSSNAIGDLRPPAADISGSEPRHRDDSDGDPWFRPGTPTPDDGDRPRHERGPRHYGDGGLANWPDESVTMPGVAMPLSFVGSPAPARSGAVPPAAVGALGRAYLDDAPGLLSGEQAIDPIEVPVAELADGAAPATSSAALELESEDGKPEAGEGPAADGAEEGAPQPATVGKRIAALLGTTRGKWIAVGVGAAVIVLIGLSVLLAVRSNKASTADVSPVSDNSPAATSSGPPPVPDPGLGPNQPGLNNPAPLPTDSLGGAGTGAAADPWVGSSSQAVPNTSLPPGQTPADLSAPGSAAVPPPPGAAMPSDPDAYDPELDGPVGPNPTPGTTPGATPSDPGLSDPMARPNDHAATPRKAGPLGSLDSITKPETPDSTGRGDSGSTGNNKTFGDGLGGLGHGL